MNRLFRCITYSFILVGIFSCHKNINRDVMRIVQHMTLDQKIGQMIMVGVPESKITEASKDIIKRYLPGGVVLYGYNLKGKDEIIEFIDNLQKISIDSSKIPLFIAVDEEGGRVKRITDGITHFPGNMAWGIVDDEDLMYNASRILGCQLRQLGVNMNLAPVLDVNNNPNNPVINTRSFGSSPSVVSRMGLSYIKGLKESKCIAVAKHFPGHGDTDKDSHLTLPIIPYDISRLHRVEFPPFIEAINTGVEVIMTAHISFPRILQNMLPATLSKRFLIDILREEMGFKGLIISDDMEMKAISKMMDIGHASLEAIHAGVDIVLISTHGENIGRIYESVKNGLNSGYISLKKIDSSVEKIIRLKLQYNIMGYKEGRFSLKEIRYNEGEINLLSKSHQINKIASRLAIFYYGEEDWELVSEGLVDLKRIFLTSNKFLQNEIKENIKNNIILNDEAEFFRFIKEIENSNRHVLNLKKYILYYHIDEVNFESARKIIEATRKNSIRLLILSTGNPFPLSKFQYSNPILFTFSNTRESIRQMIACLNGEFKPRREINVSLGF